MKILLLDIETQPMTVEAWSLWDKFIPIDRIITEGYVACFAAKWLGEKELKFHRVYGREGTKLFDRSHKRMIEEAHKLISEADAVVHYNGTKFDMPTLNQAFLILGMKPPAPYKDIDLYRTVRQRFRLPSNKLSYVARVLGLEGKVKHKGLELWHECAEGDEKAWKHMERYNKQDVRLLENVYHILLPWIKNHPNYALYTDPDRPVCTNCGSSKLQKRGFAPTKTQKYQRYQCQKCGTWTRDRLNSTPKPEVVLTHA